ncbi:hypothetical protein B0H10DRAFT_1799506, partial [Mycena sp. CBHHK59/15]
MDRNIGALISTNRPPTDAEVQNIQGLLSEAHADLSQLDAQVLHTASVLAYLRARQLQRRREVDSLASVLSPIRRVPPEILSEIFLCCLANGLASKGYLSTDSSEVPLVLGRVSSTWRAITLATPSLW